MMDAIIEESSRFAATASSLLQEYTTKLDGLRKEAEELADGGDEETQDRKLVLIHNAYIRLESGLVTLARSTSQRLEHSDLDDSAKLELQVRLADFEASMQRTKKTLDFVRTTINR